MKIICFYLPQFHETEDNNKWWGKGFTDWIATRNAKPLFEKHNQPRVPLDANYYDLSDEKAETISWQAKIAKEYGVDGFCIYHYWFAGKKELEKPAEILLKHPEIDIEYSFCWDSGSWKRTWFASSKEHEILIEQKYGDEEMWEQHFNDLLPFFKDPRYIKIENKPVFHIYRAHIIDCLDAMKAYWNMLAKRNGFEGIYIIAGDISSRDNARMGIDAYYNYEPVHCFDAYSDSLYVKKTVACAGVKKRINKWFKTKLFPDKRDAKGMYQLIKKDVNKYNKKVYYGTFVNYDDTPRRQMRGVVYTNNDVSLFENSLSEQMIKSKENCNEYVYINAWNEWGEGACVEPDSSMKYAYLEAIKRVKGKCK